MPGLLLETASGQSKIDSPAIAPVAELQVINFQRLAARDSKEEAKLFEVARTDGFFFLDLRRSDNNEILNLVENIYTLAKDLFGLDESEKLLYDVDKIGKMKLNGYVVFRISSMDIIEKLIHSSYKPMGRNTGGTILNLTRVAELSYQQESTENAMVLKAMPSVPYFYIRCSSIDSRYNT